LTVCSAGQEEDVKQFVVLIGMIALGIMIFQLIMGPQEDSVFNVTKGIWSNQIVVNRVYP